MNLSIVIIAGLFMASALASGDEDPLDVPIREKNPICAYDPVADVVKYFEIDCLMNYVNCGFGKAWREIPMWLCLNDVDSETQRNCIKPCSGDLSAVCATDGKRKQIFPNSCFYNVENCLTKNKWTQLGSNDCGVNITEFSELFLPYTYNETQTAPKMGTICAIVGDYSVKLFDDECMMRYDMCRRGLPWRETLNMMCSNDLDIRLQRKCSRNCSHEYEPICTTNGKKIEVFSNSCLLEVENCYSNNQWQPVNCSLVS